MRMAPSECPNGRVATVTLWQIGEGEEQEASPEEWQRVVRELREAFLDTGCAYLSHHGIPAAVLSDAVTAEKQFFELDDVVKKRYTIRGNFHGYVPYNSERYGTIANDLREGFTVKSADMALPDEELPSLRPATSKAMKAFFNLAKNLLAALDLSLDKGKGYLKGMHHELGTVDGLTTLRYNYYPPMPSTIPQDSARFGAHIDFSTFTIIFTGDQSGLQICDRDGTWLDVAPNNLLVLCGEFLHLHSNKEFVATTHRVTLPQGEGRLSRCSVIYFVHPDRHVPMWPPSTPHDPPAPTAEDYMFGKLRKGGLDV